MQIKSNDDLVIKLMMLNDVELLSIYYKLIIDNSDFIDYILLDLIYKELRQRIPVDTKTKVKNKNI